jgi:Reverse transcriptase (RNA-dependent DNA polymerase)
LTFDQAWNHPDPFQHARWREAITLEYIKMEQKKVWIKVKRSTMPSGCRCVRCKWVVDIKRNGVFRAHLVACGYSHIPGVDFTEAYSPVINDVMFHTLLLIQLIFGLCAWLLDIQVAFLHDLDELMFCPYMIWMSSCFVLKVYPMSQMKSYYFAKPCMALSKLLANSLTRLYLS